MMVANLVTLDQTLAPGLFHTSLHIVRNQVLKLTKVIVHCRIENNPIFTLHSLRVSPHLTLRLETTIMVILIALTSSSKHMFVFFYLDLHAQLYL